MTDQELYDYCGFKPEDGGLELVAKLSPEKRATLEQLATVEGALALWLAGLGDKPPGVIVCRGRSRWVNKDQRR